MFNLKFGKKPQTTQSDKTEAQQKVFNDIDTLTQQLLTQNEQMLKAYQNQMA